MKKIFKTVLAISAGLAATSCASWLETSSPSVVDADFVFSDFSTGKDVMLGAYDTYVGLVNEGLTINLESIGSDIERASVGLVAAQIGAAQLYGPESLGYTTEKFDINDKNITKWATYYSVIARCNNIIANIKNLPEYEQIVSGAANDWSDLLGQAHAMRATCYYDLARIYGDVIYMTENELGQDVKTLTSRDQIIETEINNLIAIEPLMYQIGENNHLPDQMTRNYVCGLIGRLCFMEAGYATRRTDLGDDFYKDANGNVLSFEVWGTDPNRNASYGRRSDGDKFYEIALPYLKRAVEDLGGASLITVDPRTGSDGRLYGNPFQYYFDQVTKQVMPVESVYEVTMKQEGGGSRIAYNWGRGSDGGSPAYPPKANAQLSTYPEVFYGFYDPMDMRRDATLTVTGSTGLGAETICTYTLKNRNSGGIGMNKYDLNRQTTPDTRQLYSGINYVLMRQADIILMLAEAYAETGDTGAAEAELKKVHNRAFHDDIEEEKYRELLASCDNDVLEAIYKERGLELLGENSRRWDLIRTGKLPEVAVNYRKTLVDGIADLKSQGYIQYDNGNQYPAYVWTKLVNAREELGYRLTMQTPADYFKPADELTPAVDTTLNYALLVPGWRGQHDDWESVAEANGAKRTDVTAGDYTNLAIVGLFRYIAPGSEEAQKLEACGYKQTNWGVLTYCSESEKGVTPDVSREAMWSTEFMIGYSDADYAAKKAPIYLIPMQATVCSTTGLKNGYGFKSE